MVKIYGTTIELTRGEPLSVMVMICNPDGSRYVPASGDVIRFAMKAGYNDPIPVITKEISISTFLLNLTIMETAALTANDAPYVYDIQITRSDGTVDTFIDRGLIFVHEEENPDAFPTDPTALDMMSMVSPIYDQAYVVKWLYEVMGRTLSVPRDLIRSLPSEEVPNTATWMIPYWENLSGIVSTEDTSIEARRAAVLAKQMTHQGMNHSRMEEILSLHTERQVTVVEDPANMMLGFEIGGGSGVFDYGAFIRKAGELKQSHIAISDVSADTEATVPAFVCIAQISTPSTAGYVEEEES